MTFIAVQCPHCQSDQIVKRGKTARGTQRYLCQNTLCPKGSFLLDYCNRGCLPEVKQTIIDMSLNASGVRDTARSGVGVQSVLKVAVLTFNYSNGL
jgi:transposase-like protein